MHEIISVYFDIFDNLDIYLKLSINICLILLFAFFLSKLINLVLFLLFKYFANSKGIFDSSLIVALKKPIIFFVWLFCFIMCINLVMEKVDESILQWTKNFKFAAIYLLILIFLMRGITQIKRHHILKKEKHGMVPDYAGLDTVEKLSKVSAFIVWSIFILGSVGVNLNGLLAFGGAGGILVGFAGKDLLTNIFGGLMIYLDKPFAVGDWISSPDQEIEGDVEMIGWRQTRILTFEKFPIYVPNSIFGNIVVQNKSRLRSRRIFENLSIRYTDFAKINNITKEITAFLKEHPAINKKYTIFSSFQTVKDGLLVLIVHAFAATTEWVRFQEVKQEVLLKVIEIIKKNGAEIAFNVTNVNINSDTIEKQQETNKTNDI